MRPHVRRILSGGDIALQQPPGLLLTKCSGRQMLNSSCSHGLASSLSTGTLSCTRLPMVSSAVSRAATAASTRCTAASMSFFMAFDFSCNSVASCFACTRGPSHQPEDAQLLAQQHVGWTAQHTGTFRSLPISLLSALNCILAVPAAYSAARMCQPPSQGCMQWIGMHA